MDRELIAQWVSASDQLPPHEDGLLYNHSSVDVLCYDGDIVRSGYYYFVGQYWVVYGWVDKPNVTHWCPQPPAPTQH